MKDNNLLGQIELKSVPANRFKIKFALDARGILTVSGGAESAESVHRHVIDATSDLFSIQEVNQIRNNIERFKAEDQEKKRFKQRMN